MAVQYKAFISYRHHPEDIAVATQIHRLLERYHVPHELKKQGRQIGRIFRDKDELPTSSNLSEDIFTALENAEYLIVICSTRTKESIWIEREIEHFLKTHTRDKVLTVLVNGEPGDVIPEKILFETKTTDDGTEEKIPLEPLSCDWRGSKKEAVNRELPRLAAVLLGCSYDDLVRRQQKYKARRIMSVAAAAFVVVFAVACYYIYSASQIRKSLNESLYNQAEYLASESIQSFDDGDRLKAVALALEAIGEGETERPYNPKAELALAQAIMPYGIREGSFVSVAAYSPGEYTQVKEFALSDDEKYLYTADAKHNLTAFDIEKHKKIATVDVDGQISSLTALADHTVLVERDESFDQALICYGVDGTQLWKKENVNEYTLCENGKKLIVRWKNEDYVEYIVVLDAKTGAVLNQVKVPDEIEYFSIVCKEYINADFIALKVHGFSDKTEDIYICNIQNGDFKHLYQTDYYACNAATVTEDGKLLVMEGDKSNDEYTGRFLDMISTSKLLYHIKCYDVHSGELLWKNDFVTYRYLEHYIEVTPDKSKAVCVAGNSICVLDFSSGKKIYENEAESAIIDIYVDNERVLCLTENGKTFSADYAEPRLDSLPVCSGAQWIKVRRNRNIFALSQLSTGVIEYGKTDIKPQWEAPKEGWQELNIENGKIYSEADEAYCAFDLNTKQTKMIEKNKEASSEDYIGMTSDGVLWCEGELKNENDSDVPFLFGYDFNTGDRIEYEVKKPEDDKNDWFSLSDDECTISEDRLLYVYEKSAYPDYELRIVQSDLNGENLTFRTVMKYDSSVTIYPKLIDCTDRFAYLYIEKENWKKTDENRYLLVEVEISTGNYVIINSYSEDMNLSQIIFSSDDVTDRYALALDGIIRVRGAGSETGFDLTAEDGVKLSKPVFDGNEIFALGDDKYLYRFRATDGSLLSKTLLNQVYNTYDANLLDSESCFTIQHTSDGYLIANVFGMANIFETEQWTAISSFGSFLTYDEPSDSYICQSGDNYLSYNRLTREELIEQGKELVKDYQLTEKEKEEYGIN